MLRVWNQYERKLGIPAALRLVPGRDLVAVCRACCSRVRQIGGDSEMRNVFLGEARSEHGLEAGEVPMAVVKRPVELLRQQPQAFRKHKQDRIILECDTRAIEWPVCP